MSTEFEANLVKTHTFTVTIFARGPKAAEVAHDLRELLTEIGVRGQIGFNMVRAGASRSTPKGGE